MGKHCHSWLVTAGEVYSFLSFQLRNLSDTAMTYAQPCLFVVELLWQTLNIVCLLGLDCRLLVSLAQTY